MTRTGRDSTTAADIPQTGTQVAIGYANGTYQWSQADWDRFAHIPHAMIDVNASNPSADVLDIEQYDATVAQAPGWVRAHNTAHAYPGILYCSRDTLTPLFNELNAAGLIVGRDFRLFVATLDGTRELPDMTGVWGVQHSGEAQTGGHYDESLIYDDTWKASVAPPSAVHAAAPAPPGLWLDAILIGRGLDSRLWRTSYNPQTGTWSTPVREP